MIPCPFADTNVCRGALFMCNNDNQTATQKPPKMRKEETKSFLQM